jgi:hypothetical protein
LRALRPPVRNRVGLGWLSSLIAGLLRRRGAAQNPLERRSILELGSIHRYPERTGF